MAVERVPSTERRQVPAGHAIAVVLLTLLLAALLDADSLVTSVAQEPFGTSRSVSLALARPVRTVSHWTGLNRPRLWLNDLVNGHPARPSVPVAAPVPRPANAPPSTAVAPSRRVPSAAQPLRIWMAGDSLMGSISESFGALTNRNPAVNLSTDVQIGTGLARPDVYDWPDAVARQMAKANPDVIVFMFGANDDQDMEAGGHRVVLGSDEWRAEYTARVSRMLALSATAERQVIWIGIPAVKRPRLNQTKDTINAAVRALAAQYPGVSYIDAASVLDGPGGAFTSYLAGTAGPPVKVRESDGIHLTLAGANRVSPLILAPIEQFWGLHNP